MQELWQLYGEDRESLAGKGATKDDVFTKGLLHGAAHVWIWRARSNGLEVLVQKRAATKPTWPNFLDISAAGHIDLGESPEIAAKRETVEETGLEVRPADLELIKVHKARIIAPNGNIEYEFKWMYAYQLKDQAEFQLPPGEVASLQWIDFKTLQQDIFDATKYVPQGPGYFEALIAFLKRHA